MHDPLAPARDLTQAYRNANPAAPLDGNHPWYVDLSAAREQLRPGLLGLLRRKQPAEIDGDEAGDGEWARVVFVSQRGTGKTTELRRISADLRTDFEVIDIEANAELNSGEFEMSELLLIIALGVERHMRLIRKQALPAEALDELQRWFAQVTNTDVRSLISSAEAKADGKLSFANFAAGLGGFLRYQSETRTQIVQTLSKRPGELVALVNRVLDDAHRQLRVEAPTRELLVIVDNLDRYQPEIVDNALVLGADHVAQLHTNLILTPPLGLVARPQSEPISNLYDVEYMRTPRLRQPTDEVGSVHDPGRRLLLEVLERRIDRDAVFDDPDAVALRLISLSGGSMRELLRLLRGALAIAQGERLTLEDVNRNVKKELGVLRLQVTTSGYAPELAQVAATQQLGNDIKYMDLVYRRWVMAYNGASWFDVSPLLREIPEVKAAIERVKASATTP